MSHIKKSIQVKKLYFGYRVDWSNIGFGIALDLDEIWFTVRFLTLFIDISYGDSPSGAYR